MKAELSVTLDNIVFKNKEYVQISLRQDEGDFLELRTERKMIEGMIKNIDSTEITIVSMGKTEVIEYSEIKSICHISLSEFVALISQ